MQEGPQAQGKGRLDYIDWMRGLACVLMFQTHAYDSWLAPAERKGGFFRYSQLLGTLPAPLFLFLAGVSLALAVDSMEARAATGLQIARSTSQRGLRIFLLALLFRFQEYALAFGWAPWTDLLRVDILNVLGLSLVAASIVPLVTRRRQTALAASLALLISLVTPLLWTTHKPDFLPWWAATYINGGHTDFQPKSWLFPLFPWMAFAFAGCAAGLWLIQARKSGLERRAVLLLGTIGVALGALALRLDSLPVTIYPVYDFWHTSPNFFLLRVAILLVLLAIAYGWLRLRPGKLWSPLLQLGTTSLLVYWVHVPIVYGRFSLMPKQASSIALASMGLAALGIAMTMLSLLRTRTRGRGFQRISNGECRVSNG